MKKLAKKKRGLGELSDTERWQLFYAMKSLHLRPSRELRRHVKRIEALPEGRQPWTTSEAREIHKRRKQGEEPPKPRTSQ